MSGTFPLRVVGVGTPHGDDALGWDVLRLVAQQSSHPALVYHSVEGGQRLLELLDGTGTLVLIDAVAPGGTPGRVRHLIWPDLSLDNYRPGSTHSLGVVAALTLAKTLNLLPPRVILWGIEGKSFIPESPLSPEIQALLPGVALRVSQELESLLGEAQQQGP